MRRNWYRRLLLSYFPIFLVTVTILVFLSFLVVNEISRKETSKADAISTRFIMENVERSVTDIEMNVLKDLQASSTYPSYLNGSPTGQSLLYDTVDRIRKLMDSSDLIDSVYLYRASDQTVLTHRGETDLAAFPDRDFLQQALLHPDERGWSQVRDFKDLGSTDETATRVISMYKRLPLPFGSQGIMVININMYQIERIIDSMTNGSVSFLVLRDEGGSLIFEAHNGEADGSTESGGKVLTTIHSDRLGWTFESGLKAGQLYSWVSVISYIWIVIAVLTVLLAIVYIIYISRRNYRPIQGIMSRLQSLQLRGDALPSGKDELALIDSALESLITQSRDYEKQHHENLLLQRSQLFADLIGGQDPNRDLAERLRKIGPFPESAGSGGYAVVLAEMNEYNRFQEAYSARDQNVLKFALMNVFQELAQSGNMHSWMEWLSGRRAGILVALSGEEGGQAEALRDVAASCRKWVEEKLHLSVGFGIGSAVGRLEDVEASFRSASEALQHRLSLGQETVLVGDELPKGDLSHVLPYLSMVSELVKDFRLSNDGWRNRLQELFESFRKEPLRDEAIRSLLQTLLQMLSREVGVVSEELNAQMSGEKAEAAWKMLNEAASLDEMQARFGEFMTDIYRTFVAVSETKSYRAMISEMRSYIEEHFDDPDLSLKHLSDRFQVSGKYASYLFKTEFGMKFVDFLVQLRMRRAEELLAETDQPIQDIAIAVGYANSISFGRVFKRTVGVTPGDYRRLKSRPSTPVDEAT
ncbi:helix-turn-helix domain-containing protein [Cohnella zeiphila]|uniref:AraC family transcriptional regulator n=1 Tax=Cohnella zeiphila TaxID=2761120 RepID=A0A7X0SRN0_9BACL|nr:helix-turn-helix domain-containing protein [Cohnella zeiphila]MBB6734882.1 AraC family transcriptional regulator [Cohnella zeiphila]